MGIVNYLPFNSAPMAERSLSRSAVLLNTSADNSIAKLFKVTSFALGFTGFNTRASFEEAPYDLDRVIKAADTDSFVRQAFNKYRELLWKEGWDIVGENDEAVDYLRERIDYMELAMGRSIDDLWDEISDQLVKFGNCFIAKSRGDLSPFFPGTINALNDKSQPIVGYYIIPAETVVIQRNNRNKPIAYRQRIEGAVSGFGRNVTNQPTWPASEVIHLAIDKKPGRAFGTPFMVSVMDDVIALRQMEEDIQNLVHKELFPLYKYKVGTEMHPAEPEEIDNAIMELENLRSDGGLVLPERHDVDIVGSKGAALEATGYLEHFVNRVVVGLGLSPHHLGVMMNGGNRSVTDRLDVALYDKVKKYQRYLSSMIRIKIFTELLIEGGFDPISNPKIRGISDRCEFQFKEIDVDTQVKKENHALQKWTQNAITMEELRLELGLEQEVDEDRLFQSLMTRLQPEPSGTGMVDPKKPDAAKPSTGGKPNPRNDKSVKNKSRPSNQYGRNGSPNIRRDDKWLYNIVELIGEEDDDR